MIVETSQRKSEFDRVGFADKPRACIKKNLRKRRRARFDPRHRQHCRIATACWIIHDIENILHSDSQTTQRAMRCMGHWRRRIGHKGVEGIISSDHCFLSPNFLDAHCAAIGARIMASFYRTIFWIFDQHARMAEAIEIVDGFNLMTCPA